MSLPLDFVQDLKRATAGDLRADPVTRTLYSTDASIYQITPKGVFIPKTQDELQAAVELAAKYEIPILPRGSGSSLAGQAVGDALILDLSRHLDKILEINPEARTATVEPGVILSDLNRVAAKYGLGFGPDPASADRATLGGALGNNATGAHSIRYGMAADHFLSADVLLADGSPAAFGEVSLERAAQIAQDIPRSKDFSPYAFSSSIPSPNLEATLYAAALHIRAQYADAIRAGWTKVWRNTSGYRLNYLLPWSPSRPPQWEHERYPNLKPSTLNLAHLLAGSEGTLAVMQRMKVNLVSLQKEKVLVVLSFKSIPAAMDAAPEILESQPSAVELLPRLLIDLAREVPAYAPLIDFVDDDASEILVVEYAGDDPVLVRKQAQSLGRGGRIITDKIQQSNIWKVRKVGLGILSTSTGATRGVTFIEDCAVPVEHLGDYVRGMERVFAHFKTEGVFYAHASAGVLHMRPVLNLQSARGQRELREMAEAALGLVLSLGGAMTGEHGDGLARSEFLGQIYGKEISEAFRVLKLAADPKHLLNPGKIVAPAPMDENLRYGADYAAKSFTDPILNFDAEGGLVNAIENCNGAGVCRGFNGTMCPSFQATREESHTTRGRANMLRVWISSGALTAKSKRAPSFETIKSSSLRLGGSPEEAVADSLDLCLACKGCKSECPSGVDMAKLKYEFFNHYYKTHPRKLRDYLFGYIGEFAKLGAPFGKLVNQVSGNRVLGDWVKRGLSVAKKRSLPQFARYATRNTHHATSKQARNTQHASSITPPLNTVLYLPDAFTRYFEPEIEAAAMQVLRAAGMHVITLPVLGAGRTLISKSFLDAAKKHAQRVRDAIVRIDPEGKYPVVGAEPSEIYTLKDEYLDFFPNDKSTQALAARTWLIDEFLLRDDNFLRIARLKDEPREQKQPNENTAPSANQKSAQSAQSVDKRVRAEALTTRGGTRGAVEKQKSAQSAQSVDKRVRAKALTTRGSTRGAVEKQKSAQSVQSVDKRLTTRGAVAKQKQPNENTTPSANQKSAQSVQSVDKRLRAEALTTRGSTRDTVEKTTSSANQKSAQSAQSAQSVDKRVRAEALTTRGSTRDTVEKTTSSANQKSAQSAQSVDKRVRAKALTTREGTRGAVEKQKSAQSAQSAQSVDKRVTTRGAVGKISLHSHCYQKARPPADDGLPVGQEATAELLRKTGYEVEIIPSGCCGMAGSFGYEKEHYELSMQVGELFLFPEIRKNQALNGSVSVAAPGASCREQIVDGTGVTPDHPIVLVARRLDG